MEYALRSGLINSSRSSEQSGLRSILVVRGNSSIYFLYSSLNAGFDSFISICLCSVY